MHPSPTKAQVYQMDDPCYHIGGGVPQIDIKIKKSYVWYLKKPYTRFKWNNFQLVSNWYLQVGSFQQSSDVHKKYKTQASTIYPKMHTLASIRSSPFMEIDDKGGEIVQRYESFCKGER